jgi:hypothetical protein
VVVFETTGYRTWGADGYASDLESVTRQSVGALRQVRLGKLREYLSVMRPKELTGL